MVIKPEFQPCSYAIPYQASSTECSEGKTINHPPVDQSPQNTGNFHAEHGAKHRMFAIGRIEDILKFLPEEVIRMSMHLIGCHLTNISI